MVLQGTDLAALAAAISAVAASLSAYQSRRAIALANKPVVWPAFKLERAEDFGNPRKYWAFRARLYNDGPGVALDVRWSVQAPYRAGHRDRSAELLAKLRIRCS